MGQAAPSQMQQFQDLVETRGITGSRSTDREDLFQPILAGRVVTEHIRAQQRLASTHPVLVASDGVDLTVVRDTSVGMGQRPGRERVRRETGVHDTKGALHAVILQIQIERA